MACLLGFLLLASAALPLAQGQYRRLIDTDVTPCIGPCIRVGNCGYDTPNPKCNITLIAEICNQTCGCNSFNSNGWLKGCANTSCGIQFEGAGGTDTYVLGDGMPIITPDVPVTPIDDDYYPAEEGDEGQIAPAALQASADGQWALLQFSDGSKLNASVGDEAQGFVLVGVVEDDFEQLVVVVERTFQRWGFIAFLAVHEGGGSGVELGRLRKGTGHVYNLRLPNFNVLLEKDCAYFSKVASIPTDYLGHRIMNDTADGEATFLAAIKYMAPQRDYASIGSIIPYQKYSVSPDGRIKAADHAIYTPDESASATGPGTLVWDPRAFLPSDIWPATNFTYLKSALVGGHLRVVSVTAFEPDTQTGFEQIAFAPVSEPSFSVYVRLRAVNGVEYAPFLYKYYNVSLQQAAVPLDAATFYKALFQEQAWWNKTLAPSAAYSIPGHEGQRQTDMAHGALVASLSLFVDLQPNYGDGEDYWSPQVDRGGSLPFQEIAVVQNLLDVGLIHMAGDRLGWWMDNYINADGSISTGHWEDSCPFHFADGFADYGEMMDIISRTMRGGLAFNNVNGTAWVQAHVQQAHLLANYSYTLRLQAKNNASTAGTPAAGLIWGPPEHDTCHSPGYYYHNQAWFIRGFKEMGKLFRDICPSLCPQYAAFGATLLAEADALLDDFLSSINQTATFAAGVQPPQLVFIPPIAELGVAPFKSMIESVVSEYSNFRYFSELLGADVLPFNWSVAVQEFRESTFGTVSGITRWSDHLDDMPSSYYLAASLRDDRLPRFFLLQYGHMANYMGRGTFTATEQIPILTDANGFYRDYLWSYLEGGIDECIPSIMLPAIATRWQFVLERYDTDILWLLKGAPRRWADPATGGTYGIDRAATRFGWVSVHAVFDTVSSSLATGSDGGARAVASLHQQVVVKVTFEPVNSPGVTQTPQFAVRLRGFDPQSALNPSSVVVVGEGVELDSLDAALGLVYVNVLTSPGPGKQLEFSVTATVQ